MPSEHWVFDGHTDVLLDLHLTERGGGRSFFERGDQGHVDLPRAADAGYGGGFFAMFTPNDEMPDLQRTDDGYEMALPEPISTERAQSFTDELLSHGEHLDELASDDEFRIVRSLADFDRCRDDGVVVGIFHLEGAEAVEPDLSNLATLYDRGVRSIGLVWSRPNDFGHGVPFRYPATPDIGPGLTDAGRALVRACEDRGIVVDLAHLNAAGFWDVAGACSNPLVVSHTAVHAICPATRNLTDDQLDAIADSGGVVGISLAVENLREDGDQVLDTPVSVVADHVEYVADRIGIEHVALGSDFDGCTISDSVGDVTGVPKLLAELESRGFDDAELAAFAHGNWRRVLDAWW
ncbi:dipeptidase [Haloarchaeobius sp. DFWS5]|uniref:dipeptidase n=1 Tax=Haloarchaeobius sp. DFWS5 TaxID=3446114 RepID=UPI003EBE57B4